jgi:TetR/AcrR family transcriptional regulator, cholesterol catabolism regulator
MLAGATGHPTVKAAAKKPARRAAGGGPVAASPDFLVAPKARGRAEPVSRFPEIVNAAAELFRRQGYADTSIEDIANVVGILKGSIYHYIHTKEDLLFAIIDEIYARTEVKSTQVAEFTGGPVEQLHLFIDLHMEDVGELAAKVAVFATEYRSLPEDRRLQVQARRDAYEDLLRSIIRKGQRQGAFVDTLDARITAIGILQMLNGTYQWYRSDGPRSMGDITREYKKLVMRGLLTDRDAGDNGATTPPA